MMRKLALICTNGGHFEQLKNLEKFYAAYDHFWITTKHTQTEEGLKREKKYFVPMAHFSRPWEYLVQIPSFLKIFLTEKPTHVVSTGSGRIGLVPFLIAKLFRIKFIYIDTFSYVRRLSKFGRMLHAVRHPICVQWEKDGIENTTFIGPVFQGDVWSHATDRLDGVFVTVGTREEPFGRLVDYVERLVQESVVKDRVVMQAGFTKRQSAVMEIFDFCPPDVVDEYIRKSRFVISQESAGTATRCLRSGTKFIVVPRDYSFGELPARSDMEEDLHLELEELGFTKVASTYEELRDAVNSLDDIRTGFQFNNDFAISRLKLLVDE